MTLLYIDTNIFLNVINSEINPYGKDIAAPAGKLLYDALSCKYTLLVSTWTIKEMLKKIPVEKVKMTLVLLKDKIKRCEYTQDKNTGITLILPAQVTILGISRDLTLSLFS